MDELGTALRDLAREAQAPPGADPAELWRLGRTRVRRRRIAGVAIVAALAAVVFGGTFAVTPPSAVGPAGSDGTHSPAIPENVYEAKSWYPSTEDEAPGVVAVIGGVARGDRNGLFTISAETGDYRILHLPDAAKEDGGQEVALSPDGRHIAYWLAGTSQGEGYPTSGDDLPVGVGVYDTVQGKTVERYLPRTEHGIGTDNLLWVDNDLLMITYGQRTTATASRDVATWSWRPIGTSITGRFDEPTRLDLKDPYFGDAQMQRRPTGRLTAVGPRRFAPLGWEGPVTQEFVLTLPALPGASYQDVTTSPAYVVAAVHEDSGEDSLRVAPLTPDGTVRIPLAVLDRLESTFFVGWLADDRILVMGAASTGDKYASFYSVDLTTGEPTRLGTAEGGLHSPGLSFATDLLTSPMVKGEKPPTLDPRWTIAGGATSLVVLGSILVSFVRRRRRG